MISDVYWRIIDSNGIGLVKCRIVSEPGGKTYDYEILKANSLFLNIFGLKKKEFIGKNASKAENIGLPDGQNWLSFFDKIFDSAGKEAVSMSMGTSNEVCEIKSYLDEEKYLYVYIRSIESLKPNKETDLNNGKDEIFSSIKSQIEKEKMYELLFNNMLGGCIIYSVKNKGLSSKDYIIDDINSVGIALEKKPKHEIVGKSLDKIRPNIDKTPLIQDFHKVFENGGIKKYPPFLYNSEDYNNYYENVVFKIGENRIVAMYNDVTETVLARNKIEQSKNELLSYIENAPYGIFISDKFGRIIDANKQMLAISGWRKGEIIGKSLMDFVDKKDWEMAKRDLFKQRKDKERFEAEYRCVNKDREIKKWNVCTVKLDKVKFIGFVNDITELRLSQIALQESETRFKMLFEDAPLGCQLLDEEGRFISVNNSWLKMLGYKKEEVLGKSFSEFIAEEDVSRFKENFPKFKVDGATRVNFEMVKKTGEKINVRIDGFISRNKDGSFKQTHCILQDITAQLLAEHKLVESEKRYSSLIESISDVIMVLGDTAEIIYASPNVEKLFGWNSQDLMGKLGVSLVHPEDAEYVGASFGELARKKNSSMVLEFKVLCEGGGFKYIHLDARNLFDDKNINGVLLNFHDITERVTLEKEKSEMDLYVRNQQKLESIGTLASGVAHEINNPINGIMNYSQVILDSLNDDAQVKKCAEEIIHETGRVSDIVKNLLGYSRPQKQSFEDADVKEILRQTLSLMRATIKHDSIDMQLEIAENLPSINCRSGQIQQVIMNLVTNARDSLNSKYSGADKNKILIIRAKKIYKTDKEYIRIEIEDFGMGIPTKVQNRIFDPFFTTKSRDKGTGLGLAISYNIVKEHEGSLTFDTKPDQYTKFYLDLPLGKYFFD